MEKPKSPSVPQPLVTVNDLLAIDPQMTSNEEWYTTEAVMEHLNMSRSSVYRLRIKKELPAYKLGRVIVYPKSLINKILLLKSIQNLKTNRID
ncbi:helix-turn-helix domain-containing protein [Flavobacteriaceae bacterium LMO-SS05]